MTTFDISDKHPVLDIPGVGSIRGVVDDKVPVVKYLNIPFATVEKRWNPATPVKKWDGVRDGTKIGPAPTQSEVVFPNLGFQQGYSQRPYKEVFSERDGLNLNVYAPHPSALQNLSNKGPLPVLVWIYGGGFQFGGNYIPQYDGTNLVAQSITRGEPIIYVTINYRVSHLGWAASKELKEEIDNDPTLSGEQKAVGNWGLQDQKLAFLWIREHIAAFGGNGRNITAFGESAGSVSIAYHLMTPAHYGLFQRAILQSGSALTLPTKDIEHTGQAYFDYLLQKHGIPTDDSISGTEKLARLRAIPEDELAAKLPDEILFQLPTIDGVLIDSPAPVWHFDPARLDPGIELVLLTSDRDETTIFVDLMGTRQHRLWDKFASRYVIDSAAEDGSGVQQVEKLFGRPTNDADTVTITTEINNYAAFQVPVVSFGETILRARHELGHRVELAFAFFDVETQAFNVAFPDLGASHGVEMNFIFDSDHNRTLLNEQESQLAAQVQDLWLKVATNTQPIPTIRKVKSLWAERSDEVVFFKKDLTVGRTNVADWLNKDKYDYVVRFLRSQALRHKRGDFKDHGVPYYKVVQ
ncbi:hypothetical protein BGZ73_005937 [Actinomortierella ambigua]|nr:hypothetical protein BGZ73_005937 [Actinomortierella ambigua]